MTDPWPIQYLLDLKLHKFLIFLWVKTKGSHLASNALYILLSSTQRLLFPHITNVILVKLNYLKFLEWLFWVLCTWYFPHSSTRIIFLIHHSVSFYTFFCSFRTLVSSVNDSSRITFGAHKQTSQIYRHLTNHCPQVHIRCFVLVDNLALNKEVNLQFSFPIAQQNP